jgi:EAL domain-containing protein (putative c-di-GMP-specific phosphodiesterase class I)
VLHYQPIVELPTQRIVGTEALVRWNHPSRGLLAPGEFINAAEQSGLIVALGTWVLRAACQQTGEWQRRLTHGEPLLVAVNLSPLQLADRELVAKVFQAVNDSQIDPTSLCLEITESSVIGNHEAVLPTLNGLRALGTSLALDDFGTGFSSLSHLRQLPVNIVKIDRSFVDGLDNENEPSNAAIVLAIVDLAHALGMSVTAEGVETASQLHHLEVIGSDRAQGYLLGRPVPAAALTLLLEAALLGTGHEPSDDLSPAAVAGPLT